MSRVLNILVEGQTEKEFVRHVMYPYLLGQGISNVRTITIETRPGFKGGDVRYEARYKANIKQLLYGKEDMLVTSFVDYYRLRSDFPNYQESRSLPTPEQRVALIERGCYEDVNDARFIPYIQLHEFEGLLFADSRGFDILPDFSPKQKQEIERVMQQFANPELINDHPNTAPSKRLISLIPSYQKTLYGRMIAEHNGFERILQRCPRFRNWIETIIARMQ